MRSKGRNTQEAAIMAPEKEGGGTRRKGSVGRGESGRGGRTVKEAKQGGGASMVDDDLWASFENFWGQTAEGESVDWQGDGRKSAKGTRTTVTRPGRQGRSPRAS
jgi:hypothetical protein